MTRLLAALVFFVFATPAMAQCVSVDQERETIVSRGLTITALEGDALKVAERLFNSIPPETNHTIGTAFVVDLDNGEGVLAVGPDGLICGRARFDQIHWPKARRLLLGEAV